GTVQPLGELHIPILPFRSAGGAGFVELTGNLQCPGTMGAGATGGEGESQGHSRTAQDVFNGSIGGHDFVSFQYSYKVTTGSGEQQSTQTYEFMVTAIVTPPSSYRLEIRREGVFAGLARAVGFTDLEFESDEFNKKFKIKATPERFAYDVLNPRTMERIMAGC
ncbi:Protein of unknown function DUF3137 like protein, partial [Aduncisulcus paluster]